jgi:hypothetical protein
MKATEHIQDNNAFILISFHLFLSPVTIKLEICYGKEEVYLSRDKPRLALFTRRGHFVIGDKR